LLIHTYIYAYIHSLKAQALQGAQDALIADLETKLAMWEGMAQKGSTGV
jgi:hypothetical protein